MFFFKAGVRAWRSAGSIPATDREQLEGRFRNAWRAEYRRRFVEQRLGWLFQAGILLGWVGYFAVLPLAVPPQYRAGDYTDTLFIALTGSLLVILAGALLIGWISKFLNGRWATPETAKEVGSSAVILLFFMPMLYFVGQNSSDPLLLVILGLLAWGLVFVAVTGLAWVALTVATTLVRRRNPDALLAAALFGAMRSLEFNPDRWPIPEFRAGIARDLGAASAIARSFLFRNFAIADLATREWRVRQANFIADALAQKQRWLITPKPDTCDFLLTALSRAVVAVLAGSWDELARPDAAETEEARGDASARDIPRNRRILAIAGAALQTLAVAGLPAAALWIAGSRNLLSTFDPRTLDYLEIGVFAWAVVILAFKLDPRLQEKISGVKDVVSLVNPLSGKKQA